MDLELNITTLNIIILSIFIASIAIQLFYFLFFFLRITRKQNFQQNTEKPNVSVIICAKNEAHNIENFLPLILNQEYPNFEVVVVNDASYDETEEVLKKLELTYKHLRHTTIPENKFKHGKKLALTIGIKSAKYEHLVLTDADCYPLNKNWISTIIEQYTTNTEIVIGYGAYIPEKTFLNKLIRYDNFYNSIQFLGFAIAKLPYMGIGRNLSYKKSLFVKNKGFASHYGMLSGDDDLFVKETATKTNVAILNPSQNRTYTKAKQTFSYWYYQKLRHITTSVKYKFVHKILLSLEPINRTLFYSSLIIGAIFLCKIIIITAILFLLLKIFFFKKLLKNLAEKDLLLISLMYDVFSPIFYFILHLNKKFIKQKWN